jgi:hypothetical protein
MREKRAVAEPARWGLGGRLADGSCRRDVLASRLWE